MSSQPHTVLPWVVRRTRLPLLSPRCVDCRSESATTGEGRFRVNANGNLLDVWLLVRRGSASAGTRCCAGSSATFRCAVRRAPGSSRRRRGSGPRCSVGESCSIARFSRNCSSSFIARAARRRLLPPQVPGRQLQMTRTGLLSPPIPLQLGRINGQALRQPVTATGGGTVTSSGTNPATAACAAGRQAQAGHLGPGHGPGRRTRHQRQSA